MSTETAHPEEALAETLTPRDYLRLRLNANAQNRAVLPPAVGWAINNRAQKRTK